MKKFAQIQDNRVHWVFEAEEMPEFAPNIVLLDITDYPQVAEGWGYVDGEFVDPTPKLEDLKAARVAEILALSAAKIFAIETGYSSGEVKTFEQQYQGAVDLLDGNTGTVAAKFVIALAAKRSEVGGVEVTSSELAQRIIANYTAAKEYTVYILGIQQGLTTRVQLATTEEEVAAVVWE